MLILQWNARSLLANGQDFKQFIDSRKEKPDVVCIQETWLKPSLDFVLYDYVAVRCDRGNGGGGGCATFIKKGIPYKVLGIGQEQEYVVIEVWSERRKIVVINYYNPCKRLEVNKLQEVEGQSKSNVIWCGDFNAHNTLWGSGKSDNNGQVIEELLNDGNLVCLNDGKKTRVDVRTGKESVLDLTLVSNRIAAKCDWEVYEKGTIGSDHHPVLCKINVTLTMSKENRSGRWVFGKANWGKFKEESDKYVKPIQEETDIENFENKLSEGIKRAALVSIPKSKGRSKRKAVPWWDNKCKEAVVNRNRAFRLLKRTHNYQHMINYKQAQAIVRRTIRQTKRAY